MINVLVVIAGYLFSFLTSTWIVRWSFHFVDPKIPEKVTKKVVDTGFIVGKCENFLIISFILVKAYTTLGLIFTAKTIVRLKKMEEYPEYYLTGTMVNFSFSVLIGFVVQLLLKLFC